MNEPSEWKLKKIIDALYRHVSDHQELLTYLMHIAAVEFRVMQESEGVEKAKSTYVEWCFKIGRMVEGEFDVNSSKH